MDYHPVKLKEKIGGVGIVLAKKWSNNVISTVLHNPYGILLRLLDGIMVANIICSYAPQFGQSTEGKDAYYDQFIRLVVAVPENEILLLCGTVIGHGERFSRYI